MAEAEIFQKILNVREVEKSEAQYQYKQSVADFEEVATKLYDLLRKKEYVEEEYQASLHSSGSIMTLTNHYHYIEKIKNQIKQLESAVNNARSNMEHKQNKLTAAHIEIKKYQKIIDRKEQKRLNQIAELEMKLMDEASVIQFLNNEDR